MLTAWRVKFCERTPGGGQHGATADQHAVDVEYERRRPLWIGCSAAETAPPLQQRSRAGIRRQRTSRGRTQLPSGLRRVCSPILH